MKLLTVAPSPHERGHDSVKSLMYGVVVALLPALAVSVWFFGLGALYVTAVSVLACVFFEWVIQKYIMKTESTILDGSAALTGLLLAFNVPTNLPVWILLIGCFVAIAVAKMTFGGLGNNPFNPALVGRVFMLLSFPVQLTSWPVPNGWATKVFDATTGATPLGVIKEGLKSGKNYSDLLDQIPSHMEMFYGKMGGSMGEVAGLALLIGFAWMLYKKVITWHIPVSILATIAAFTGILYGINPEQNADPMFHILTGGVLLGAIYMATDYVTSPMSAKGMLFYGVGIGIITVVIRVFGAYPEGVSFAILIMNAFVPLINNYLKPKRFGEEVKHG